MRYFTSDVHLGHKAILKYRDYNSIEEHDNHFFDLCSKLKKRDILYVLGDFIFDNNYEYYIKNLAKMSCRFKVVLGNHDSLKLYKEDRFNLELQLPLFSYKGNWITHAPIHSQELRGRNCIHGHLHGTFVRMDRFIPAPDTRYFNVNLDNNNQEFVLYEEIQEYFDSFKGTP